MWCHLFGFTNKLLLHSGLKRDGPLSGTTFSYTHMSARGNSEVPAM